MNTTQSNCKYIAGLFLIVCFSQFGFAQKITYDYDLVGNRILKELVFSEEDDEDLKPNLRLKETSSSEALSGFQKVYPNPIHDGLLYVDFGIAPKPNTVVSLFDIAGRMLKSWPELTANNVLDLNGISDGTYYLKIDQDLIITSFTIIMQ